MKEDKMRKVTSFEEFETELLNNSEYRKAERRVKPYYDLALEIIKLRASLKLTQKDLAEKAGTYQSRISKIESSEFDIRLSTLINIAEALGSQVQIRFIPTNESYYAQKENIYHQLFASEVVSQAGSSNTAWVEPKRSISMHGQGVA